MYRTFFPGELLAEFDRLQREARRLSAASTSVRGIGQSGFPALNIGGTAAAVEIFAFAPGLDPATLDVTIERGVLTLAGERKSELPAEDRQTAIHVNERYAGRFHRAISLSDDLDADQVSASYQDGILHITIGRRAAAQRRQIAVH